MKGKTRPELLVSSIIKPTRREMLKVQIQTVGVNLRDISKRQSTWGLIDWEEALKVTF